MGLVNCRYTLILDGKPTQTTGKRAGPDQSRGRPGRGSTSAVAFDWKPDTWYTLKLTVEQKEKTRSWSAARSGRRASKEPEKWTIEFEDPRPNREGAAACTATCRTSPRPAETTRTAGSEIYYDNVKIDPRTRKKSTTARATTAPLCRHRICESITEHLGI